MVDSREHIRVDYVKRRAKGWGWTVEVKELQVGDYVCGNTVFEYKTVTDFIASMYDGRLKRESINQANNYPYHFVMIVGNIHEGITQFKWWLKSNKNQYYRNFDYSNLYDTYILGAIASLCTYTNVLMVQNQKDAFNLMKRVMDKCNDTHKTVVLPIDKMSRNPCFNFIRSIPRISDKRANAIVDALELTSLKALLKCKKKDFMSVNGIGETLADEIMKAIHSDAWTDGDKNEGIL